MKTRKIFRALALARANFNREVASVAESARNQLVPYFQKHGWSYMAGNGTWFITDRRGRPIEDHRLPAAVYDVLYLKVEHTQPLGLFIRDIAREPRHPDHRLQEQNDVGPPPGRSGSHRACPETPAVFHLRKEEQEEQEEQENMTLPDPTSCRRIAAECRESEPRPLLMRAIETAVDVALGEIARLQGGISLLVGREARDTGIASGRSALRNVLQLIMPEMARQLEAAANLVERTETATGSLPAETSTSSLLAPREDTTTQHLTICVEHRSFDFHACLKGQRSVWGCGSSVNGAIGDLVRTHRETFGLKIIGDLVFPTSPR